VERRAQAATLDSLGLSRSSSTGRDCSGRARA
jgi:hypothetical protein